MSTRKSSLFVFLLALAGTVLACTIHLGGPGYPDQTIPVSTDALLSLQQQVQAAATEGAPGGRLTLVINETQLTSYVASKLQAQSDPFITDPQVFLRDGQIKLYGTARSGFFTANVRIILSAAPNEQGKFIIELVEADFGPLPVPATLKDVVTAIMTEAYTGILGPIASGFRLEGILIADGLMALTGRTQ